MTALDDARSYINQRFGPNYEAWLLLGDTQALKTLVSAADYFNLLPWQGTATGVLNGDPTTLAWPRTGVFVDGVEVPSDSIPSDVVKGSYELAVLIRAKPGIVNQTDQGSNIKSVGGGGAPTVEYFAPTSAASGTAPTIPPIVLKFIGKYLATPDDSVAGGYGSAGNTCSSMATGNVYTLNAPE